MAGSVTKLVNEFVRKPIIVRTVSRKGSYRSRLSTHTFNFDLSTCAPTAICTAAKRGAAPAAVMAVRGVGTDAERELWRQTRKYINGLTRPLAGDPAVKRRSHC